MKRCIGPGMEKERRVAVPSPGAPPPPPAAASENLMCSHVEVPQVMFFSVLMESALTDMMVRSLLISFTFGFSALQEEED